MERNMNTLFSIFDMQKNFAATSSDFIVKNIKNKLIHLLEVFEKYEKDLLEYIHVEYSKPYWDVYKSDICQIKDEIRFFIKNITKFRRLRTCQKIPQRILNFRNKMVFHPYGCCLMLFNDMFPLSKIMIPIIGAISCGNTLFVKLPDYENEINTTLKKIIKEVFNDNFIYFINEKMIDQSMKNMWEFNFDLVFFSGNQNSAKNVIRTFAPRFTKIILDINNKSPVILDETADLEKAAKNLIWSKMFNAGQTSFSPYYLVIHESIVKQFINYLKDEYEKQFPKNIKWKLMTKIDSKKNYNNIVLNLNKALPKSKILFGGECNEHERKIDLTLISIDDLKSPFLSQDLSSPILPVVVFNSFSDIVGIVNHNETPSSIYMFSKNKNRIKKLLNDLESRYFFVNNITMPYIKKYWYGGIKTSGSNLYGKIESIKIFSFKKILVKQKQIFDQPLKSFENKEESIKKKYSIV